MSKLSETVTFFTIFGRNGRSLRRGLSLILPKNGDKTRLVINIPQRRTGIRRASLPPDSPKERERTGTTLRIIPPLITGKGSTTLRLILPISLKEEAPLCASFSHSLMKNGHHSAHHSLLNPGMGEVHTLYTPGMGEVHPCTPRGMGGTPCYTPGVWEVHPVIYPWV